MYDPNDMGSILRYLKLANVFAPDLNAAAPTEVVAPSGQMSPVAQQDQISPLVQQMLQPDRAQFDQLVNHIDSMPVRTEPGRLKKIQAGIATLATDDPRGKEQIRDSVKYGRYNREYSDWKDRYDPRLEVSKLENTRNTNDRQVGANILRDTQASKKLDETKAENKRDFDIAQEKLKVSRDRAATYRYRTENPSKIIKINDSGELIAIHPVTGEADPVIDEEGNPVKSSSLTDAEKIKLNIQGRLTTISASGDEARKTEGVRQAGRLEAEADRQLNRLELKSTPAASSDSETKPLTPAAARTDRINKIINLVTQDPSLKKYFVYGGNKAPTGEMVKPKDGFDAEYQKAKDSIEGKSTDIKLKSESLQKITNPDSSSTKPTSKTSSSQTKPTVNDYISAAKRKVEPGNLLYINESTDPPNFGQFKSTGKQPKAPWKLVN